MGIWAWNAPLGLGAFILAMAVVLLVLALTIHTLSTIPTGGSGGTTGSSPARRRR